MMGGKGFGRARKLIAGILASMMVIAGPAQAATVYWSGATSSDWTDGTNWSALPTNDLVTDVAGFNAATYTTQPAMNAAYSVSGLSVEATSGAVTLSGPSALTLGATGISIAAGAGAVTLDAPIVLGAAQTWSNLSTNALTVNGAVDTGGFLLTVGGTGNSTLAGAISGTGGLTKIDAGQLTLGAGIADVAANTFTGLTTLNLGEVFLNKADGTDAIRGDILIAGGNLNLSAANQINNSSNITISSGGLRFYNNTLTDDARNETIASLTVNGGTVNTAKGAPAAGNDIAITGALNLAGGQMLVNSSSQVTVGGMITISGGAGHVIGGNSTLRETRLTANGGMTFTGGTIGMNYGVTGAMGGRLILNGDVTVNGSAASAIALNAPGSSTVAPIIDLGGASRAFNIADTAAGYAADMTVGPTMTNGSLIKNGTGTLLLANTNTFTSPITWNEGILGFGTNISASTDGAFGNFAGPLVVPSVATPTGLMGMASANNTNLTFDLPLSIPAGAGTFVLGSRSNTNGATVATNYSGTISLTRDLTVDSNAFATAEFSGTMSGAGRTLTKTGDGTVRLTGSNITPFSAVNYNGGTVQFAPGTGNTFTQGGTVLNEGNIQAVNGTLDFGSTIISTTNRFTAGLREGRISGNFIHNVANASGTFNLTTSAPNVASVNTDNGVLGNGWVTNSTYVYTGQIFVPDQGGGQGSFSFGESFDDSVRVTIDGVQRLNNTVYNATTSTGTVTLAAGWHTVELRFGQGTGSVGRVSDGTNHWGGNVDATHNGLGFGYDALGLGTSEGFNYVAPTDNGSMSLFRAPTSMLIANAGATIKAGGFTKNGVLLLNGTATTAGAIELSAAGFTSDTQTIQVAAQASADTNPMASITMAPTHILNTANLQMVGGSMLSLNGGTLNVGQSADATSSFGNWVGANSTVKLDSSTLNFHQPIGVEGAALSIDLGIGNVNFNESANIGGLKSHGATPGTVTIAAGKALTLTPPAGTFSFGGTLAGGNGLNVNGTGTLELTNSGNTFGGAGMIIDIASGVLAASNNGALGDATNQVRLNGGSFRATDSFSTTRTFILNQPSNAIEVAEGKVLSISNPLSISTATNTLTKNAPGVLVLGADHAGWDGVVTVASGAVRVTSAGALGTITGNTIVNGNTGIALQIAGNINVAEPLQLALATSDNVTNSGIASRGALESVSGDNIWSGPITLSGTGGGADNTSRRVAIGADAGSTLTVSGGITANFAAAGTNRPAYLVLVGEGTGNLNSLYSNLGTGVLGLQKRDSGTWNVTFAQTYTGNTYVHGGNLVAKGAGKLSGGTIEVQNGATLTLDDSGATQLANRLGNRPLNLQGGTLNYIINSAAASSEVTTGTLTINGGGTTTINVSNPGTQNHELKFGSLSFGGGSIVNFTGALGTATNKITFGTAPGLNDNILPRATIGGDTFATYDATNGITTYTGYDLTNDLNAAAATSNMKVTASPASLTASKTINSLLINGTGLTVGGALGTTLTIESQALLVTGGSNTISVPTLSFGDGTKEAVFNVNTGAALNLNSVLTSTGGFSKSGGGELIINTASRITGAHYFNNGMTRLAAGNNTLVAGQDMSVGKNATVDLGGSFQSVRDLLSGTTGTANVTSGAGGTITGTAGSMLIINQSNNGRFFPGSLTGGMALARFGQNTFVLTNANSFTGKTLINSGTTRLQDLGTLSGTTAIEISSATLHVDNTANLALTDRINDAASITLRNATLNVEGRGRSMVSETLGAVILDGGQSNIYSTYSTAAESSNELTLASVSRTAGSRATVQFRGLDQNAGGITLGQPGFTPRILITAAPTLTNGIIGAWATNARNFVSYNAATGVGSLNSTGFPAWATSLNTSVATDNVRISSTGALSMTADRAPYTLAMDVNNDTTMDLGGFTLRLGGGGLMSGVSSDNKIMTWNNGQITAGTVGAPSDLYFYASGIGGSGRNTVVNATIVDNGAGGAVTLVKGGDMKMTLTGNNTYTGGAFVNQGTLELNTASADGNTTVAIPGDLTIRGSTVTALSAGQIKNTANVTMLDGGTLTLVGDNTLASLSYNNDGGLTVPTVTSGGTLTLSGNNAISVISKNLNNSATIAGTLNLTGATPTINVGKVLVNNLEVAPGLAALNISAQLQASNGFTKIGEGVLALSNTTNAWSGTATVDAGTLRQTAVGALSPNAAFVINSGATLDLNGLAASLDSIAGTGTIHNPGAASVLTLGANNASTNFAGLLTSTTPANLSIVKSGSGSLALTNVSSNFAGGITVNAGSLVLPGTGINATGSGLITLNSGAAITGGGLLAGGLTFNMGASANVPLAAIAPINTGTGLLTVNGLTTLNLTGAASAGTFPLFKYGNLTPLANGQFASFKLGTNPGGGLLYGLVNNTAASTVDVSVEAVQPSQTWTGAISGAWDIGTTANWAGAATYTSPNQVVFNDGPTNTTITGPAVTPQAITVNSNTANYSIANNIGGAMVGGLTKSGSSTLTLTGANSFSGPINVTGGTLRASVGSTSSGLGAGAITLSNGTTLHLDAVASTATPGITGSIYTGAVTGNLTSNKDFANTIPTDTRVYTQVNKPKNTSPFYTGGPADNHASLFVGKININYEALYGFFTQSDDASRLFIDGQLVVENQGNKGTIEAGGTIRLAPGLHDVRIEHTEGTGDSALIFSYQGAGMAKQVVPGTVLYAGENANDNLINLGNSLNISGSSNLNLEGANFTGVQLGLITAAAGSTLNVTGPTSKTLRASGASLNGNTIFNSSIDMTLGQVLDNGSAVTITKTGTGRLTFDNTNAGTGASSLLATSSLNVQGGKLVLKGASGGTNPIGSAAIALNGGGLLLDSRLGSATFDNPVAVNLDSTIEVLPSGQTQTLGSATNGITIAAGKTLTLDVYGGARNGTAGNSSVVAQGAALTIAGPISGVGSNLVIRSTQFNGLQTPVNGTVNLLGALTYTGSTSFVGAINMNGSAPLTVSLGGDATLASTSTFAAPVTLVNARVSSNNATVNLNRIPDATAITLHNSALALIGSTSASRGETVGDVTLASGINQFQVTNNPGTGNLNTLTAASLTRSNRSTAAFVATTLGGSGNSGRVVFTSAPTADLVGGGGAAGTKTISVLPYAFGRSGTASTTPWVPVTHDANGIRPLSTSTELSGFTIATGVATYSGAANDNARLAFSSATAYNAGAGIAFNSFTIDNTASNSTQTATLTGTVTVNSGQVILASSASTNSALNFNGGTLEFGTREANLFVGTTNTATIGSVLSGSGGLTASSMGGMLSLTGANTALTGTVTVNGAVLQINADAALGAAANPITLSGGVIRFNAASLTLDAARVVTLPANSFGGFDVGAQSATVASQITGGGTLMLTGGGNTLTLNNAANNFTGPIYVQGGHLVTNVLTDHNITNHGTLSLNIAANQTYSKVISGVGSLNHNLASILTFSQPQAYVGNTAIRTGTIVAAGGDNTLPAYTGLTLGDTVAGSFGTLNLNNTSQNLSSITATALTTNATVSNAITNLGTGRTLNVSANGTGDVLLVNQGAHLVVSGGGAMNINAPSGRIHMPGFRGTTAYYGLDATALSSFTANVATINVGYDTDNNGRYGALDLAAGTNSITATDLFAGYSTSSGGVNARVTLGTTNTLNVDNLNVGINKASGRLEYATGLTNPTLTIRGKAGGTSRANLMLGRFQSDNSGTVPTGTLDLTVAGRTGSIDAMLGSVVLASMEEDSSGNNPGPGPRGYFRFNTGTVDINSLVIAQTTGAAVTEGTATGEFSMGGGTLAVNTEFVLGRRAETSANTGVNATFNLTGGVATINTPIITTANATSTLTLNGGTLDMTSKAIGTATDPIDALNFQSGTLKNVAQINGGAAIAKTTAGTLVIDGVNGYTGATAVNEGTLRVNSSIATSASVTVATGATFVAGATQVVKTLDLSAATSNASILAGAIRVLSVGDNTAASPLTLTGGKMDLNTSALVVDFTAGNEAANLTALKTAIIAGRGTGVWDGTSGLTSSAAAAASSVYGVGYAPSSVATGAIDGVTPDASSVVARYTRLGDANLDGAVNFFDLTALAAAYGGAGEWYNGDFDYSGTINFFDLTALAANYGTGLPSEAIPGATPEFSADLAAAFASVPEPGAISLLGLAALALLKRRNRKAA